MINTEYYFSNMHSPLNPITRSNKYYQVISNRKTYIQCNKNHFRILHNLTSLSDTIHIYLKSQHSIQHHKQCILLNPYILYTPQSNLNINHTYLMIGNILYYKLRSRLELTLHTPHIPLLDSLRIYYPLNSILLHTEDRYFNQCIGCIQEWE